MKSLFKNDFSRAEKIFLAIIVFLLVLSSSLLYADFHRKIKIEDAKPIGVLKFKYKSSQRKYAREVVWEEMENQMPIYNQDTIRTGKEAKALLELFDGTQIELSENTMIVLNLTGQLADIGFLYGGIRANQKAGSNLKISTTSGEVNLTQGGDISLSASENKISVSVQEGQAVLTSGDKSVTIEEKKRAILEEEKLNIEDVPIKLISPQAASQIFTETQAELLFEWEAKKKAKLEISRDREFRRIWKSQEAQSQAKEILPPGVYYWRVRQETPKEFISETRSFIVLETKKLVAISPPANAVYEIQEEDTLVNFQFSRHDYANSYFLKISPNPDLSNPIIDEEILTPFVARRLSPGTYYWQVSARLPPYAPKVETPIQKFTIIRKLKQEPPILQFPPDGYKANRYLIPVKGILFSWQDDKNYSSYILEVAFDKNFSKKEQILTTQNNFYWKKELNKGTYFWRVIGKTITGEERTSLLRQFVVEEKALFRLLTPEKDTRFSLNSPIEFQWLSEFASTEIFFLLAKDSQFNQVVIRQRTKDNRFVAYNLEEGNYFWKVFILLPEGIYESETRSFVIFSELDIKIIEPKEESFVDMSDKNALRFVWEGEKNLEYKISLFAIEKENPKLIFSQKTRAMELEFSDLKKLNEGRYFWIVETNLGKKSKPIYFTIGLQKKPEPPEIELPETFYIE